MVDTTAQRIWMLCVFALFFKTALPDTYIAYFKWFQARDARKAAGIDYSTAEKVVRFFENSNSLVIIAAVPCILAVVFLLIPAALHFSALTLVSLVSAGLLSTFGAIGDRARAQALATR